jgi:hypothetical protein
MTRYLHSKEYMNVDTIMSCVSYLYLRTNMIRNVAHMNRSGFCVQSQCRFSLEHMFGNERWNLLKMWSKWYLKCRWSSMVIASTSERSDNYSVNSINHLRWVVEWWNCSFWESPWGWWECQQLWQYSKGKQAACDVWRSGEQAEMSSCTQSPMTKCTVQMTYWCSGANIPLSSDLWQHILWWVWWAIFSSKFLHMIWERNTGSCCHELANERTTIL